MKLTTTLVTFLLATTCNAQIILKGYKCVYDENFTPYVYYELYHKNDTFLIQRFDRDIADYFYNDDTINGHNDKGQILKAGLNACFASEYFKTKDSLYYNTGKDWSGVYYYQIFVPEYEESISVRSNKNDATFSDLSKWLLSQIRLHRKQGIVITNEKHQICQDWSDEEN